ncbi:PilZ domain-containing protein [Rhodovibrio salinarum]|uniref:PilZ domain-containing protein n=1 Tax=Rhodovibrio salinarum TaxID=1087 RepID=UPI00147139B5|nr:PilZ domain-containing protein [Rhodovibrio salinarum]
MHDDNEPKAGGTLSRQDRRAHRRSRVLWGATLMADGVDGEVTCTVVDISAGGAKLMLNEKLIGRDPDLLSVVTPGERVTLSVRASGSVPAEVVWQEGDRAGLRFLIDPADVRARFPGVVPPD